MVALALYCGLRHGEILDLRWRDLDFRRRLVVIVGATAKSSQTRVVPMHERVLEALQAWKPRKVDPDSHVFPARGGGRRTTIRSGWRSLCRESGITGLRFHDLRASFATSLVERDINLSVIRDLMGHSSVSITERFYAAVKDAAKRAAVESL